MLRTLLVAATLLLATPAAAQTTIDFDELAAPTCVYASAPPLGAQYAGVGVTFSGDIGNFPVVVPATCLTIGGASPPNIVGLSGAGNYLRADFTPSVGTVSIRVGNYNRAETFTLTAYDAAGGPLATRTYSPPFRTFGTISVTAPGTAAVVLTAAHAENAIDTVTFSSVAPSVDAGVDAAVSIDAGARDAGTRDAGARDAAMGDAAAIDAAIIDAAIVDAAIIDAAVVDAAVVDAAIVDAAIVDAAMLDAAVQLDASAVGDAGALDAGSVDASTPDAAAPHVDGGIIIPGGCRCEAAGPRGDGGSIVLLLALGVTLGARGRRSRRVSFERGSSPRP